MITVSLDGCPSALVRPLIEPFLIDGFRFFCGPLKDACSYSLVSKKMFAILNSKPAKTMRALPLHLSGIISFAESDPGCASAHRSDCTVSELRCSAPQPHANLAEVFSHRGDLLGGLRRCAHLKPMHNWSCHAKWAMTEITCNEKGLKSEVTEVHEMTSQSHRLLRLVDAHQVYVRTLQGVVAQWLARTKTKNTLTDPDCSWSALYH